MQILHDQICGSGMTCGSVADEVEVDIGDMDQLRGYCNGPSNIFFKWPELKQQQRTWRKRIDM